MKRKSLIIGVIKSKIYKSIREREVRLKNFPAVEKRLMFLMQK